MNQKEIKKKHEGKSESTYKRGMNKKQKQQKDNEEE